MLRGRTQIMKVVFGVAVNQFTKTAERLQRERNTQTNRHIKGNSRCFCCAFCDIFFSLLRFIPFIQWLYFIHTFFLLKPLCGKTEWIKSNRIEIYIANMKIECVCSVCAVCDYMVFLLCCYHRERPRSRKRDRMSRVSEWVSV